MKKQTVEERRTEILETTCQVVIERGFAATRISDVAKRLEVSSSLIHYHFDSKEQLLAEAFAHYAQNDLAEMLADIESVSSAVGRLDQVIQNMVPEGSDDLEWMLWIDGWGEALRNPMMKRISEELDEQTSSVLERVLSEGVASGEFGCPSPSDTATRLTALIDGLAVQFAAHTGMTRDQLIDHVRSLAAWEVGLTLADFHGAGVVAMVRPVRLGPPGAATETALRQLVDRYCDGVVRHDVETWASTWAVDATWELRPGATVDGREAIVAAWEQAMKGFTWVVQSPSFCVFEVDEATGEGTGRVTVHERFQRRKGGPGSMLGTYHDTYRREAGVWRFTSRRLDVIDAS